STCKSDLNDPKPRESMNKRVGYSSEILQKTIKGTHPNSWVILHSHMNCNGSLNFRISTTKCRFNRGDVNFLHGHHFIKGAFGGATVRTAHYLNKHNCRNLPGNAPFAFTPATLAFLTAFANNYIPVSVGFFLIFSCHLK